MLSIRKLLRRLLGPEDIAVIAALVLAALCLVAEFVAWLSSP